MEEYRLVTKQKINLTFFSWYEYKSMFPISSGINGHRYLLTGTVNNGSQISYNQVYICLALYLQKNVSDAFARRPFARQLDLKWKRYRDCCKGTKKKKEWLICV